MSRQAIVTKYYGPTDRRGSRVQARCEARTSYYTWDDALDVVANHRRAAMLHAAGLGWTGRWTMGSLPHGGGYVFVTEDSDAFVVMRISDTEVKAYDYDRDEKRPANAAHAAKD